MQLSGLWHIYEMEQWDEDYFNMEVQAYIKIEKDKTGDFQFGLVRGELDEKMVQCHEGDRFEFTWQGGDECDPASGSGWCRMKGENSLEGEFRFHGGDDSTFLAKRVH
jgi:hypothetical protein